SKGRAPATQGARHPEPAEGRQLRCQPDRVDPKTEAQQVHLETLASGEEDADQAVRRYLKSSRSVPGRRRGTPLRGSGKQKLPSMGARYKTNRSNAAPHPR